MRKNVISIILSFIILIYSINTSAAMIYEKTTETTITKGVTQYITQRYTDNGWYKIYKLKIDLNENFLGLKTLTSEKGVNTRDNVLELAKESNALAGVNADFFQPSGSMPTKASALGVVIEDGKLLTTPARGKAMATVAINNDNIVSMGIWDQYITLTAPDGAAQQIYHVNKYYDEGGLIIFNNAWDEYSPGMPLTRMEMVVVNDIVTEIRTQQDGVKFPENGYIIASTSQKDTFLTDHFNIGDKVSVQTWINPSPSDYKMAVGGGTLLLKDGKDAPVTHNISGTNPRTAMGVDQTGKIVYLVSVDGRQSASVGMTMNELRNYMRDIGCYNAINFDGGGSTTYVSKEPSEEAITVKNVPSDGSLRKVANGVGVISSAPIGEPAIIEISTEGKSMYANSTQKFNVKVYDKYYHNLEINKSEVKYSVSGIDGYFTNDVLSSLSFGTAIITASYKTLSATVERYIRPSKQEPDSDSMKSDTITDGTKIAVFGYSNYTNILGKLYTYRAMDKINAEADTICLLDTIRDDVSKKAAAPLISGEYYYAAYKNDNLIIQLDNRIDGLRKSDSQQWNKFLTLLDNVTVKNVIITLSQPPTSEGFSDSLELNLFKQILEERLVDKGKNVFVVYDDSSNSLKIENGIRYFGLKGVKDVKATNFTSLKESNYLLITSNNDGVSYQFKSILDL